MSIEAPQSTTGHSASVQIRLHARGQTLDVSQISDRALFFAHPILLNPGPGTVEIMVDGKLHSYEIEVLDHAELSTRFPIHVKRSVAGKVAPKQPIDAHRA